MATAHRTMPHLSRQDVLRFFSHVNITTRDECWEWQSGRGRRGYGLIKFQRRMYRANRLAYFLRYGVDPGLLYVCHTCDNPPCCNWRHLFLGTNKENIDDASRKNRLNTAQGDEHWTRRTPERIPRGKRSGNYRPLGALTAAEVLVIRSEYETRRATQVDLAHRFGVTQTTISNIVRRKTWTSL